MRKKIGLLLATAILVGTLAACGSSKTDNASNEITGKAEDDSGKDVTDNGTYEKLTLVLSLNGTEPADKGLVEEEISKITREKIGAEVTIQYISGSTYADQLNLMLASEEKADVVYVLSAANGVQMTINGAFHPLEDLIANYGQGIVDALGKDIAYSIDAGGGVYLLPTVKETAKGAAIIARKDILDELGIDPETINSMKDYEDVLKQVKAKYPDMIPFLPASMYSNIGLTVVNGADRLYDQIGVLMDVNAKDIKVEDVYASERYKEHVTLMRNWYEAGLISKDVLAQSKEIATLTQAGRLFSYVNMQKPGQAQIQSNNMGHEMCLVIPGDVAIVSDTETLLATTYAIPYYAENPELSMKLLNLMYSDADIANLLGCGVEGVHYVVTPDGFADFANGLTSTTTGYYYNNQLAAIGNEFLTHPWKGNDADVWSQYKTFNDNAIISPARGFIFDPTPVQSKYAAVQSVVNEYRESLEYGIVDPKEVLPEFISKLGNAGMGDVIAEKQKQLDTWLENRK